MYIEGSNTQKWEVWKTYHYNMQEQCRKLTDKLVQGGEQLKQQHNMKQMKSVVYTVVDYVALWVVIVDTATCNFSGRQLSHLHCLQRLLKLYAQKRITYYILVTMSKKFFFTKLKTAVQRILVTPSPQKEFFVAYGCKHTEQTICTQFDHTVLILY